MPMFEDELEQVGRVLGLEPATTAEFRVLIDEANYLQLDDLVVVRTMVPKAGEVRIYGVVTEVASCYEGSRFESDTLRIDEEFTMDADKSRSATVQTMRVVPEIWVAPDPGQPAWRVSGEAATRRCTPTRWDGAFRWGSRRTAPRFGSTSTSSMGRR